MTRHARIMRRLRWHWARMKDDESRLVFLPGHRHFTGLRRDGLMLQVWMSMQWPFWIEMTQRQK